MPKGPKAADPFDVWGKPPPSILRRMSEGQKRALRRYIQLTVDKSYRVAFDNGVSHAFTLVSNTVMREWRSQRDRMLDTK